MNSGVDAAKIAIGTVQFGQAYGIANRTGQVSVEHGRAMLAHAAARGVDTLDTAIAYGSSEEALGAMGVAGWNIVSKLPQAPEGEPDLDRWVDAGVRSSLQRLRVPALRGMLLHRPAQLLESRGRELYAALVRARETGLVEKVGVSVYDADELDRLPADMPFDIVQVPLNVLDRRLLQAGRLDRMVSGGCEVHVRSVFLQGLLLLPPAARPSFVERWPGVFGAWDRWLASSGRSALEACIGYAASVPGVSRIVVGMDSLAQTEEVMQAAGSTTKIALPDFGARDPGLLNPSLWPKP